MKSIGSITRTMRRVVPALACALALGACTTWIEAPPPGPSALNEISGPIRVVRPDGFSVVLRDAYVTGDTLYGYPSGTGIKTGTRMAVPLRDVVATQRHEMDPLRSLGALAVGAAATFGTYVLLLIYGYSGAST
jgi:hypothetical protein